MVVNDPETMEVDTRDIDDPVPTPSYVRQDPSSVPPPNIPHPEGPFALNPSSYAIDLDDYPDAVYMSWGRSRVDFYDDYHYWFDYLHKHFNETVFQAFYNVMDAERARVAIGRLTLLYSIRRAVMFQSQYIYGGMSSHHSIRKEEIIIDDVHHRLPDALCREVGA